MKPPPNYVQGQARSKEVRARRSEDLDRSIWASMVDVAIWFQPKTLAQFAEALNAAGIPTRRGRAAWTAPLVHHELAAQGVTARQLWNRVTQPAVREGPTVEPSLARRFVKQVASIDSDGEWVSATKHPVHRADLVRHKDLGIGQMLEEVSLGRFECRFSRSPGDSFDAIYDAAEIAVFKHNFTREERQAATEQIGRDLGVYRKPRNRAK
jgi:hypothetical protein